MTHYRNICENCKHDDENCSIAEAQVKFETEHHIRLIAVECDSFTMG